MRKPRTIVDYGDRGLLVEWENRIDRGINASVHRYRATAAAWPEVMDAVPAYCSLLLVVNDDADRELIRERLYLLAGATDGRASTPVRHRIPVLYDGPDLAAVAASTNLSIAQVIHFHIGTVYQVYQVGFRPGFAFLGDLDPRINVPRLPSPRPLISAGSVAIAGAQTAVYPSDSPGGWRIIGRCPLPMLRLGVDPEEASVLAAGDSVYFIPITPSYYKTLLKSPHLWND